MNINLEWLMGQHVAAGIRKEWAEGDRLHAFTAVLCSAGALILGTFNIILFIIK